MTEDKSYWIDDGETGPPSELDSAWYQHHVVSRGYPKVKREPKQLPGQTPLFVPPVADGPWHPEQIGDEVPDLSVHDWIAYGVNKGFCSPTACATHDGVPSTDDEAQEWEDGLDPCQHIVRVYNPDDR